MPEAVLISLQDPDDAMAEHERMCFAECARVPIDAVKMHHIANSFPPIQRLEEIGCVFFGGSGTVPFWMIYLGFIKPLTSCSRW